MFFLVSFQSLTGTALLRPLTLVSCSAEGGSSTYLCDNAYYEPTGHGSTDKQGKLHQMASNTLLLKTESICWLWDSCGHNFISGVLLSLWTALHYCSWLSWLAPLSSLCCHIRRSLQECSDNCLHPKSFIGKKDAQETWIIHKKSFQKYVAWFGSTPKNQNTF